MIYSPYAIDYSEGVNITDVKTGIHYTDAEAKALPKDSQIRKRLVVSGKKIGCDVMTIEECNLALARRKVMEENSLLEG